MMLLLCALLIFLAVSTRGLKPAAPRVCRREIFSLAAATKKSTPSSTSSSAHYRLYNVEIPLDADPGKDSVTSHEALVTKVQKLLRVGENAVTNASLAVVKKAFDGRWKKTGQPKFVYTVDVDVRNEANVRVRPVEGKIEVRAPQPSPAVSPPAAQSVDKRVVVVGAGPAGLFAAIALAEAGVKSITIVERGQAVETRGKDIGALFNRKLLDPDSNLCYGEGGAGTWSDGKLTTRIGKNSEDVRAVLEALVAHGAPARILIDGKPHLGTDRLVRILRDLRAWLVERGVVFRFGATVVDVDVSPSPGAGRPGAVTGVQLKDGTALPADAVVLAVGHSARALYRRLVDLGVHVESKPIAVGFRVEHPQELINRIQYGAFGALCDRGKGKVPVADYRLAHEVPRGDKDKDGASPDHGSDEGSGPARACYSFCMCPGGQIVPTSVDPEELCLNGMSFSKRQSQWANSALVVSVTPDDYLRDDDGLDVGAGTTASDPLRGVAWQKAIERRAAAMGGGRLVAPVQRLTDFLDGKTGSGGAAISSSYRMGVREAPCHELYPAYVTDTLRQAVLEFDRKMPGFLCADAVLHGVETRTSAPVQITRYADNFECISLRGLYPAGEGAGYAGGIVSAAVDGMRIGRAIAAGVDHGVGAAGGERERDRQSATMY